MRPLISNWQNQSVEKDALFEKTVEDLMSKLEHSKHENEKISQERDQIRQRLTITEMKLMET